MQEADKQEVKTKRESMSERLAAKYPDMDFADDEVMFGRISDDYDDYDNQLNGYKEREQKLTDMFSSDPRSAHFLTNWSKGSDPVVELVKQFGTDIKDAIDDPERLEQIAAANKEFVDRVAQEKELENEYQANMQESLKAIEDYQQQNGLSDDQVDEVMSFIIGIVGDAVMGKFSPETIDMARKALHHDEDVAAADYEGEVRGKNAKIEEKLRQQNKGDGVSALNGKNSGSGYRAPQPSLGALDNYGDGNMDIWERGGEKRVKYSNS